MATAVFYHLHSCAGYHIRKEAAHNRPWAEVREGVVGHLEEVRMNEAAHNHHNIHTQGHRSQHHHRIGKGHHIHNRNIRPGAQEVDHQGLS